MASGNTLHFDPDLHPDDTLKAFNEFIQSFYLRYEAQYPDPPKVSIDAAIERWKLANEEAKPTLEQYDTLRNEWRSKDRVAKFLGMFSSRRMYADWQVAEPDVTKRAQATWEYFVAQIQAYYKPTENLTDAHQTGPGAMLAQGDSIENARPVAIASRTTNAAEQRYPQIDLEALAIDFALRRFRQYIVGSPTKIQVITDHQPLCSIFNGKRQGSIRTERIKLRHQDIRFTVTYQRGKINQSDYLSRHAKPIEKLTREERQEADDLNNLLYMLRTTPIIDCMGIGTIAQATQNDPTLKKIATLVNQGLTWIEKTESKEIQRFQKVLPELTMTANSIILKGEKIVLPSNLQDTAIRLAHRGAHPGQSGLERRLRYHFFFQNMSKKIEEFVKSCNHCSMFIDKKTKEPIKPHRVPEKCWDTVSVDLFGPIPSSKTGYIDKGRQSFTSSQRNLCNVRQPRGPNFR